MFGQGINPGEIFFAHSGHAPSGMRTVDVMWDNFVIPPSTDMHNYSLDVKVKVTTNTLEDDMEVLVEIYGMDGKRVFSTKKPMGRESGVFAVPTAHLPSGVYAYKIMSGDKELTGRVVKK